MFSSIKFLLIGIGIGILIAPDKGSVTRQKLLDSLQDYKDDAKDFANKASDKVKDVADKAKDAIQNPPQQNNNGNQNEMG